MPITVMRPIPKPLVTFSPQVFPNKARPSLKPSLTPFFSRTIIGIIKNVYIHHATSTRNNIIIAITFIAGCPLELFCTESLAILRRRPTVPAIMPHKIIT